MNTALKHIMASLGSLILVMVAMIVAIDSSISKDYTIWYGKDVMCMCTGTEDRLNGGSGPRGFTVKCSRSVKVKMIRYVKLCNNTCLIFIFS